MIEVRYRARLGNWLFQYCFARILAEELGYQLAAESIPQFAGTFTPVLGKAFEAPVWECPENANLDEILADRTPRRIVVGGYMQDYRYYRPYREKIRAWLALPPSREQPEPDALVLHVRLGDYRYLGWVLAPEYYHLIIARERFSRLYVVTDEPNSPYLETFARYKPTLVAGSAFGSLRFIRAARRIVLAQSTFSWWGAYLSEAERIYFPIPRKSLWSRGSRVNLRVDDPRYVYVENVPTLPKEPLEIPLDSDPGDESALT